MKKLLAAIMIMFSGVAYAWEPTKTVTVISVNQPGGGNELAFRMLAAIVQKNNPKVNFNVQHHPGADGVIALNHFITMPNDGSYLSIPAHMSLYVTNDIWFKKSKRFEYNSFTSVLTMGKSPLVLIANAKSKVNTPEEFMKTIANTKEKITVGIGGGAHRTTYEYLASQAKANKELFKFIDYNGPAQALLSVAQNENEFGILPISIAQPQVEAGLVKVIGITGNTKMPQIPNARFLNDVAPGTDVYAAWTLVLPPKTNSDIVEWYQREFSKAALSQEYLDWCEKNVIFIERDELTPDGVSKTMETLRKNFIPVLINIKEGENQ
jgi:tripartite-type tricarboxylate transporter receptor subunit TctC